MPVDATVLHDVLASLEVQLSTVRRSALHADGLLPLTPGTTSVGYVVSGGITADVTGQRSCAVDAVTGLATATPSAPFAELHAGDAFLAQGHGRGHGRSPAVLAAPDGAQLVVADISMDWPAGVQELPPFAWVSGFSEVEPAAAALAANLGPSDDDDGGAGGGVRPGDSTICRMMVTTVVLSLVRAWAQVGCAPEGWPRQATGDPHLARAAAAVLSDPARDWTVDQLAAVAALSRSAFAEKFRAAYGRTPLAFVTEVRMRRAMRLLEGGTPVFEVARSLGYASEDGFSRAFRRFTGAPPSQWRTRQRAEAELAGVRFDSPNSTVPTSSRASAMA
ncbi:AraC-type DNA-binding protein [Quadrisphaera granulorum]|uniref:AraC-like DNA-binding protein n=1 Tax=Quadrisphaera granulorum TaxID=317664 RepID=A0A316A929_9ACTN|nr:AraC family transcriptional regulator [Quadrisphaera granulorum]PWJ53718.1 AraC-like DNA-binding protein [Quadrisphaera granulorum]SZE96762.1 AraC-type DNA-binding protein [Quadrisphaera granulorum]